MLSPGSDDYPLVENEGCAGSDALLSGTQGCASVGFDITSDGSSSTFIGDLSHKHEIGTLFINPGVLEFIGLDALATSSQDLSSSQDVLLDSVAGVAQGPPISDGAPVGYSVTSSLPEWFSTLVASVPAPLPAPVSTLDTFISNLSAPATSFRWFCDELADELAISLQGMDSSEKSEFISLIRRADVREFLSWAIGFNDDDLIPWLDTLAINSQVSEVSDE